MAPRSGIAARWYLDWLRQHPQERRSQGNVAAELGVDVRTVRRWESWLRQAGLVQSERPTGIRNGRRLIDPS
jgi:predicted ArsR family transcriptional regulator